MLITRNFHTLYELCDFVKTNNIDVFSKDVEFLGEYVFHPSLAGVCYTLNMDRPPKYTILYEDHQSNVGPLDSHYVEDFSEN